MSDPREKSQATPLITTSQIRDKRFPVTDLILYRETFLVLRMEGVECQHEDMTITVVVEALDPKP